VLQQGPAAADEALECLEVRSSAGYLSCFCCLRCNTYCCTMLAIPLSSAAICSACNRQLVTCQVLFCPPDQQAEGVMKTICILLLCLLLMCMQRAEQNIQQLQTLGPQLQQLHAAMLQGQSGAVAQPPSQTAAATAAAQDAWTSSAQQQARQASLVLQQQVQAALCSATGSAAAAVPATAAGLRHTQPARQQRQHMYGGLLGHLHRQ
jgi:hypothetical protein